MLDKLRGGDLRSIGRSNEVVADIKEIPKLIEKIFPGLHDHDPVLKARAADVIEKDGTCLRPGRVIFQNSMDSESYHAVFFFRGHVMK